MSTNTNQARAEAAKTTAHTHCGDVSRVEPLEQCISDLLCDLMHCCHLNYLSFERRVLEAKKHFTYELNHPDGY